MKFFKKSLFTSIITSAFFLLPLALSAGEVEQKVANELLDAMRFEETINQAREMSIGIVKQMHPEMDQYDAILREFYSKYMKTEDLRKETVEIYAEVFTLEELNDITTFYKTKTGQKALEKLPEMMQRIMQSSSARIMENQQELIEMLTQHQNKSNPVSNG